MALSDDWETQFVAPYRSLHSPLGSKNHGPCSPRCRWRMYNSRAERSSATFFFTSCWVGVCFKNMEKSEIFFVYVRFLACDFQLLKRCDERKKFENLRLNAIFADFLLYLPTISSQLVDAKVAILQDRSRWSQVFIIPPSALVGSDRSISITSMWHLRLASIGIVWHTYHCPILYSMVQQKSYPTNVSNLQSFLSLHHVPFGCAHSKHKYIMIHPQKWPQTWGNHIHLYYVYNIYTHIIIYIYIYAI